MQLEFDFTWFVFCDLYDDESGKLVGGAVLECYHDEYGFIVAPFETETFSFSSLFPVPCRKFI